MTDLEIIKLEEIANTMRGMTMDLRVPSEVRSILMRMAIEIDTITEMALAQEDDDE
jgi:hypothetical protein